MFGTVLLYVLYGSLELQACMMMYQSHRWKFVSLNGGRGGWDLEFVLEMATHVTDIENQKLGVGDVVHGRLLRTEDSSTSKYHFEGASSVAEVCALYCHSGPLAHFTNINNLQADSPDSSQRTKAEV
jgi:hypothetical protein